MFNCSLDNRNILRCFSERSKVQIMEFVAVKKIRSRKRKRNAKNKRRVQRKLKVKGATTRSKVFLNNITAMRDRLQSHTMNAHSFWENYKAAQEWQQRHSVAWWKSRCQALEYENHILRQKVRNEASEQAPPSASNKIKRNFNEDVVDTEYEQNGDDDDENFEFQVDKDMLNFLEQSIRHKIELKRCRESETEVCFTDATSDPLFVTGEARVRAKTEDARLLYGVASPRIMAMEAALQATVDRHKDRAKPNYWPNIPLKL